MSQISGCLLKAEFTVAICCSKADMQRLQGLGSCSLIQIRAARTVCVLAVAGLHACRGGNHECCCCVGERQLPPRPIGGSPAGD
jgi:hypothetical protein